jgi:hypothetical protein
MRFDIYTMGENATSMVKFGEAETRREALKIRQDAARVRGVKQVFLYMDGQLDKIGVHKK